MASLSSLQQLFDITLSDAGRLLMLSTPLGSHALLVQRVVAHEQLSPLFTFTVDCMWQQHGLSLCQLLAQLVTLSILQANGICRDLLLPGMPTLQGAHGCSVSSKQAL